jgi:hypothetical protein
MKPDRFSRAPLTWSSGAGCDGPGLGRGHRKSDSISLDTVWTTMTAAKEVVNASQAAEAFDSWQ